MFSLTLENRSKHGKKTSYYITTQNLFSDSLDLVDKITLTFPLLSLFKPQCNTFGNDMATVIIAIEGMHSYHILIKFFGENYEQNEN